MDFIVRIVSRNLATTSNSETVGICTFFEAPSIECLKMTCDVTKVTYNIYSCYNCCKSKEMMEMNGRDCVKCQNSEKRGHKWNFGIVN